MDIRSLIQPLVLKKKDLQAAPNSRWIDGWTDRQKDGQKDKLTDRQTNRQIDRELAVFSNFLKGEIVRLEWRTKSISFPSPGFFDYADREH